MKLSTLILAGSLVVLSYIGTQVLPHSLVPEAIFNDHTSIKEPNDSSQATGLLTVPDSFYVNIEIRVFKDEIEQYPETWQSLQMAFATWAMYIPVRWSISTEARYSDIEIHLADLQKGTYGLPKQLLGIWRPHEGSILLDADRLEQMPEQAYAVALHEIGHMFGVPHVVGADERGMTGFVVLPQGYDATNFVMYPAVVGKHAQKTLSWIEVGLARNNLLHHWTRPDVTYKKQDCKLFSLDNDD